MCQERLQRSLSLFVFGRGDGRERVREQGRGRAREGEWRRKEGEEKVFVVWARGGYTGARQATGVRWMAGHLTLYSGG